MPGPIACLIALVFLAFSLEIPSAASGQAPQTPAPMQTAQPMPSIQPQPTASPEPAQSAQPLPSTQPTASHGATKVFPRFTLTARRITFYSDTYFVTADTNVAATFSDGTSISGNTFAMNLKLNRFIIAGDVHVKTKSGQNISGAAFSEFFDFNRAYFVPIIEEPDRWTFVDNDFAHPLRGREMPGDTFFLPDLSHEHVFLYASKALITPRESVTFIPATINLNFLLKRPPLYVPTPRYYLNFSSNPNFAQNGLAGAFFDAPYPFAGGAHNTSAAHLRYDELNQFYLAYEQHLAITDHSYIVLSANPITRPQKSYNLLAAEHLSPKVQAQLFVQENAFQSGFSQPLAAGAFAQLQVTAGLRQSYLQFSGDEYWSSLLADPGCQTIGAPSCLKFYGTPEHTWVPDHAQDAQISWTSFDHRVYHHAPLSVRFRSGFGLVHNPYTPPAELGGALYPTVWQHFVGTTFYTPALHLKSPPFRDWYFNASVDKERQWFSSPHHVDTTSTTLSLSKTFDKHLSAFVSYSVANTGDFYGAQQLLAYPSQTPRSPITGQSYPGYGAFNGFTTIRSLSETAIWTPSTEMQLRLTWRENHDFPNPIPYQSSVLDFGQSLGYNQQADIGVSPQQLTADLRVRLRPNLLLDLTRSYYFNWGNRAWTPQFTVLISR